MENYFTFSGSWKLPLFIPTSDAALNTCGSVEELMDKSANEVPNNKNQGNKNEIRYYLSPNPATLEVTITCNKEILESGEVVLFDNLGTIQFQERNIILKNRILNIERLSSGLYYYKIKSNKSVVFTGKIIINN